MLEDLDAFFLYVYNINSIKYKMDIDKVEPKSSRIRGRRQGAQEITDIHIEDFSIEYVQLSGSLSNRQADEKDLGDFFEVVNDMAIDEPNANPEYQNRPK